jgi:hypothetical protein
MRICVLVNRKTGETKQCDEKVVDIILLGLGDDWSVKETVEVD